MGVTAELCRKIAGITTASIPADAIQAADRLVLDGLAVAVAGARTEESVHILADHLRTQGSSPIASVIGLSFSLSPVSAALINAASMHALDFEPMWKPSNHALSTTLPAVLALAEASGSNGMEVIAALIKGIEIQGWIRQACGKVEAKDLTFHQPGMVGPLGAAVAASHLLGLDETQLAHALGIAASRCSGLIANIGTMTKSTHCGYAASLGLEAALLAKKGFTANPAVFEAKQGYVAAFFPKAFDASMLLNFGPPFRVVKPGFAIKAFPCKYQTHYTIVCGLALHDLVKEAGEIDEINIISPEFPAADRPNPKTGLEGMFSLQFTLAAALLDGKVDLETFTDEHVRRADMQALLPKIKLEMKSEISSEFDGRLIQVAVSLKSGAVLRSECAKPPGSWGAPPISDAQYDRKIQDCLGPSFSAMQMRNFKASAGRMSTLDAAEVQALMLLCRK